VLVAPVTLGKNVTTGAGAVVVRGDIPDNAVMVGVPARPLGAKVEKVVGKKPATKTRRKRA